MILRLFVVLWIGTSGLSEMSWGRSGNCLSRLRDSLGILLRRSPPPAPELRFADPQLNDLVVPVLVEVGWVPQELKVAQQYEVALRRLGQLRKDPRVISLFEIPHTSQGKIGHRLEGFLVTTSARNSEGVLIQRQATNLEIFERHILTLHEKYQDLLTRLEREYSVTPLDVLSTYLKYSKAPMGLISPHLESHARYFQELGLNLKNSLLMAIALGHETTEDLKRFIPKIVEVFVTRIGDQAPLEEVTAADFVVSFATRFGSIPLKEIAEVAPSIHHAAFAVDRGPLNFLEVIGRVNTRLSEALYRMGDPAINPDFQKFVPDFEHRLLSLTPWKAFRERLAWNFVDRKLIHEESIQKIKNVFMIDQIYTLVAEYLARGWSMVTDDYQRYKFMANLVTFGLNDFVLGWTGVQTARGAMQKTQRWKEARSAFFERRAAELKRSRQWVRFMGAYKDQKMYSLRRSLDGSSSSLAGVARWSWDFADQGALLFKSGFLATAVGISGIQGMSEAFLPDENIEIEDRVITVLWTSFLVATWMATSSNIRYSLVLRNLQNYWEKKFPTKLRNLDPEIQARNATKQKWRTRAAGGVNALVGGVSFVTVWQMPLDEWFESEGGGHDQLRDLWAEMESWILDDGDEAPK